jgi:hypothetical protein
MATWFKEKTWVNGSTYALNATNLNNIEQSIHNVIYGTGMPMQAGVKTAITYISSTWKIDKITFYDTDGTTRRYELDLSWTDYTLNSYTIKAYDTNGTTVLDSRTDTLAYSSGKLTTITRS